MAINYAELSIHWNYYLAIEQDLMNLARYIEFCENNEKTYSIELAHILIAATSEVDVLLKEICEALGVNKDAGINEYRKAIQESDSIWCKNFLSEPVSMPRHNLTMFPWKNWQSDGENPPNWWTANNKVKHHRSTNFHQANLKNVLNAVAALLQVNAAYLLPAENLLFGSRGIEKPKLLDIQSLNHWEAFGVFI